MTNSWIFDIKKELNIQEESLAFAYYITTNPEGFEKYVYLNSLCATELDPEISVSDASYGNIVSLHVNPTCTEAFTIQLHCDIIIEGDHKNVEMTFDYIPQMMDGYPFDAKRSNKMVNSNVSYQLLRANPKLTGNIKVVVTEDSKLYLDTFKVSLALGQYKYRRIAVNPKEYYGMSLMTKFHKMSTDDFYKVEDNCYNLFTTVNDYKLQYYDVYNSGVRTNDDQLYSENYALLAPLCVKHILPDFFLVFKVKTDEYNKKKNMTEAEKIKYFFSNGELVKSFDMREGSNLGTYIREVRYHAEKYPGDIFASYDKSNYNRFIGISVDRGVVTSAYESMYKEDGINNQVAYNDYFTAGFERNKLVSKDILNLEFMFNDTSEKLFSINTYFGIYVLLNGETNDFSCIGHDGVYTFDTNDLHNFPSGTDFNSEKYKDLIYGISTPDRFIRLKESIYDSSVMEDYKLRPYRNVITGDYKDISDNLPYEYVTATLLEPVKPGEHFRVIDLRNRTIYDVIATEYEKYLDNRGISDVRYNYIQQGKIKLTVQYVSAVFNGDLESQANTLFFAFRKFRKLHIAQKGAEISIKSSESGLIFEKISSVSDYTLKHKSILENENENSIIFFESIKPEKLILDISNNALNTVDWFYLYPYYTNMTGSRIAYVTPFIKVDAENLCHTVKSDRINLLDKGTILYMDENSVSHLYESFPVRCMTQNGNVITETEKYVNYILSPSLDNTYIVNVSNPKVFNGNLSFYTAYPINSGVCSIFPLRDFYFSVLDADTKLDYFSNAEEIKPIGEHGEFFNDSVFGDNGILLNTEEYVTDYIDKARKNSDYLYTITDNAVSYNGLISHEEKHNYYTHLLDEHKTFSDLSLIAPYTCKWVSNGTDARGENMRLMYSFDKTNLHDTLSYYVPYDASSFIRKSVLSMHRDFEEKYNTNLGYLQTNEASSSYSKYITGSPNAILQGGSSDTGILAKEGVLNGRISIDDIIYSANSENTYKNKFSRVYKAGENTIEFISGGIKFRIHSANEDIINFNLYNAYQALFISMPGYNVNSPKQTELIIDEINEQIIFIWYNGASSVNLGDEEKASTYEIPHYSPLRSCECYTSQGRECLNTPNDTSTESVQCYDNGYFILENERVYDNTEYTKRNDVMLISKINPDTEFTYGTEGAISTMDPILYAGDRMMTATNENIDEYTDLYHDTIKAYVISDTDEYNENKVKTLDMLRSEVMSCSILVRKQDGPKDYSNVSNLLTVDVLPPYYLAKTEIEKVNDSGKIVDHKKVTNGFVQTSYCLPMMKDVFQFAYADSDINNITNTVLNGMNIRITGVSTMQRWINKYTESINYCIPIDSSYPRLSLDFINGVSLMDNCWTDIYRNYNVTGILGNEDYDNIEWYKKVAGYETGYEVNRFIHSRGINMNGSDGNSIDITVWKNTKISEKEKYIKLDITESLIYKILFTKGYSESWKYLNLRSNTYKIKYIKNTILPMLNITKNNVFSLYMIEDTKKLLFKDLNMLENVTEVTNVKNELRYENGKYFMYIYPTEPHTYYAKMHIDL
jgi:hypothetical protein